MIITVCVLLVFQDTLYAQNNCSIYLGYFFVCAEAFLINDVVILCLINLPNISHS